MVIVELNGEVNSVPENICQKLKLRNRNDLWTEQPVEECGETDCFSVFLSLEE